MHPVGDTWTSPSQTCCRCGARGPALCAHSAAACTVYPASVVFSLLHACCQSGQHYPATQHCLPCWLAQMMGRAGRPQYDTKGVAVVMVHEPKKAFYKRFLYEPFPVESSLQDQVRQQRGRRAATAWRPQKTSMRSFVMMGLHAWQPALELAMFIANAAACGVVTTPQEACCSESYREACSSCHACCCCRSCCWGPLRAACGPPEC
jgi:hypothetical protein